MCFVFLYMHLFHMERHSRNMLLIIIIIIIQVEDDQV